mmetsp:Transcript_29322/g.21814  ORF Transcript_29322/g.21814 Transcript_29322/m.21814 type:complete len:116 (+) Transcript_29322:267-614(+)
MVKKICLYQNKDTSYSKRAIKNLKVLGSLFEYIYLIIVFETMFNKAAKSKETVTFEDFFLKHKLDSLFPYLDFHLFFKSEAKQINQVKDKMKVMISRIHDLVVIRESAIMTHLKE